MSIDLKLKKEEILVEVRKRARSLNLEEGETEDECIHKIIEEYVMPEPLTIAEKSKLIEDIFNALRKLDVIQPLLEDEDITEIMINGPDCIFVERKGIGVVQENTEFKDEEQLTEIIQKIVAEVNREVNQASPIVDARLKDGSRVNAVLKPIALNGPILTIRKFGSDPMTIEKLIAYKSVTPSIAELLKLLVHARYNIFIAGGTGSGKTTFLNALSNFIPTDERIITIEDSAELQITSIKNLVRMETRNKVGKEGGAQPISMTDLIKSSLRMRPDRIVVGEVRGGEALDMLQAMNTGHDGSLSTGHANSTSDMLSRLETMVLMAAPLPLEAIRSQIASAIDIIIHLGRLRDKSRKVLEISEVIKEKGSRGEILMNPIYKFIDEGNDDNGKVKGKLTYTGNNFKNVEKLMAAGISLEKVGELLETD